MKNTSKGILQRHAYGTFGTSVFDYLPAKGIPLGVEKVMQIRKPVQLLSLIREKSLHGPEKKNVNRGITS